MNKAKGWVKIHRSILDNAIWDSDQPFDKRSAWVDLILNANYEDGKVFTKTGVVDVPRGSIYTSIRHLSDRWKWSKGKVENFLRTLMRTQMVTLTGTPAGTLISLINYGKFNTAKDTYEDTYEDTNKDTDRVQYKNIRNKERKKSSAPASLEEKIEAMKRFAAKHREEENNDKG